MGWMKQVINPEYDWMYWTAEQPRVREKDPFLFPRYVRVVYGSGLFVDIPIMTRGRSLGGTSCINFMIWNHPERSTIDGKLKYVKSADAIDDTWFTGFEALGNPGWNWAKVHKYLKKVERQVGFIPRE